MSQITSFKIKVVKSTIKSDHSAIVVYNDENNEIINHNKDKRTVIYRKKSPSINAIFLESVDMDIMSEVETIVDTQSAANKFYEITRKLLNQYYPVKTITVTNKDPDFVTPEIKSMLRRKNKLMRKGKISEADAMAEKIGKLIARSNANKMKSLKRDDTKTLWNEVNKLINKTGGKDSTDIGLTADDLNDHYAETSTDPNYIAPCKKQTCNKQSMEWIDEYTVFNILDKLKKSSSGPDEFPAWFLRLAAPIISKSLAHVYNLSISNGIVPTQWKSSVITPVAKIKVPTSPSDYRPISVTSILSRKIEHHIVKKYIYPAMLVPPPELVFEDQYAFRPTGSATAALASTLDNVTELLRSGKTVVILSLDFSKAFDRVRHDTMFQKYSKLAIDDCIYNWIVEFFTDREHTTRHHGQVSGRRRINASVVQGSGMGPTSYSIAESDLKPKIVSKCTNLLMMWTSSPPSTITTRLKMS